jgi:hypothetical protein
MTAPEVSVRPDWRESLSLAADLALLGIVTTIACLPVVTAGAALATASSAVDHACRERRLPSTMDIWSTARRALLPGFGATFVAAAAAGLLWLDLRGVASGRVPGGSPILVATGLLGLAGIATAAVAVVLVGRTGGQGWAHAIRAAATLLGQRLWLGPAVLAVLAVVAVLGMALPVLVPVLTGMALFALHVVARPLSRS